MGPIPSPRNSEKPRSGESSAAFTATRLRAIATLATVAMLAFSWPLWIEGGEIPQVPFLQGIPRPSYAVSWLLFATLLTSLTMTGLARCCRGWLGLSLCLLALMVLEDQHRFQPWVYQGAMIVLLPAAIPGPRGLKYVRWWFVALYIHSGLSKLDRSFCDELGPVFLDAGLRWLGLSISEIPESLRLPIILAMPLGEILVGIALLCDRSRQLGRIGAASMHGLLIAILGPLGIGHSALVLAWNGAMLVEVWVAFESRIEQSTEPPSVRLRSMPGVILFWVLVLLPLAERWGWFDAWPSHALYASHVGRVAVFVNSSELGQVPPKMVPHLKKIDDSGYAELDMTGWSRAERGTPLYPQVRATLGLAEGLAARYGGGRLLRVILYGPANRWTGRRSREEMIRLGAIRRRADRFFLNGHYSFPPNR